MLTITDRSDIKHPLRASIISQFMYWFLLILYMIASTSRITNFPQAFYFHIIWRMHFFIRISTFPTFCRDKISTWDMSINSLSWQQKKKPTNITNGHNAFYWRVNVPLRIISGRLDQYQWPKALLTDCEKMLESSYCLEIDSRFCLSRMSTTFIYFIYICIFTISTNLHRLVLFCMWSITLKQFGHKLNL